MSEHTLEGGAPSVNCAFVPFTIHGRTLYPNERWAPVSGYGDKYAVSDRGRVRKNDTGRFLKIGNMGRGYRRVILHWNKEKFRRPVHSLVLAAFDGPRPEGREAAHLNGKPWDNRLVNLRWCTHHENLLHKGKHGTQHRGESTPTSKLTTKQVVTIRRLHSGGTSIHSLSANFGVARKTIQDLLKSKTWAHVEALP